MSTSVIIAENHDVTRHGVRSMVEERGGTVAATAETGLDTLSIIEEHVGDSTCSAIFSGARSRLT